MSHVIAAGNRLFADTRRLLTDTEHPEKLAARIFALATTVFTLSIALLALR